MHRRLKKEAVNPSEAHNKLQGYTLIDPALGNNLRNVRNIFYVNILPRRKIKFDVKLVKRIEVQSNRRIHLFFNDCLNWLHK